MRIGNRELSSKKKTLDIHIPGFQRPNPALRLSLEAVAGGPLPSRSDLWGWPVFLFLKRSALRSKQYFPFMSLSTP
jgi:hypothetical protein